MAISNLVRLQVARLRALVLVACDYLRFLDEVGVQEACELIRVLPEHLLLLLLDDAHPPQFHKPLLLHLALLLLLGLSVLLQFDLPEALDLALVLLLLHALLFPRHLVQLLLLCQPLQHPHSELLLKVHLLLLLLIFHLALFALGGLKHAFELLAFRPLLFLLLLVLLF